MWNSVTGKPISHILSIGIGGSDLGPVMAYEALAPYADAGIDCRFISNIDPCDMAESAERESRERGQRERRERV